MCIDTYIAFNSYSIWVLLGVTSLFGALTFNYIPIVYEQAMARLPSSYLLTITILFHLAGQIFTAVSTLLFSFLLNFKTKFYAGFVMIIFALAFLIVFFINFLTPRLTKEDDQICEEERRNENKKLSLVSDESMVK